MSFAGKIIIFSAPSGAGKTTIVKHLLEKNPILSFSISATTRKCRGGEKDGVDYYFLSVKDFEAKIAQGQFVEYEEVYENLYYGTLGEEIERIWGQGKHVIIDADVKGGISLKNAFGAAALSVFVVPPSVEALEQRLRHRSTDSEERIIERVAKAASEISYADRFDVSVLNDNLEQAFSEAQQLLDGFLDSTPAN